MNVPALVKKIEEILKREGLSERKACLNAGVSIDFIRNMRRNGNTPKTGNLIKLAQSLNIDVNIFLNALGQNVVTKTTASNFVKLKTVYIRGQVQAGQWTQAIEWPKEEWIPVTIPEDPKYKNFPMCALAVKGDSMNRLYPDGSIVVAVNFCDLGRNPENGECVVTIRRDPLTDCFEATLKIVQIHEDGSVLLWPKSNNPDFTRPLKLPKLSHKYQGNDFDGDTSSTPDVLIQSLVIWSLNSVKKVYI